MPEETDSINDLRWSRNLYAKLIAFQEAAVAAKAALLCGSERTRDLSFGQVRLTARALRNELINSQHEIALLLGEETHE